MEQRLLDSLLNPKAYPEATATVQMIQTHVSYLFLTDQYVYKIKKPVDFGFLNFSTIDRRRFYCHEEIRLNQRLCPTIYLGVVEVRETPKGVSFQGDGQVVDYAVKMRRLPAERMLDRLIDEEKVSADAMAEIARTIGQFHRAAETNSTIAQHGSLASIRRNWEENIQQAASLVPNCLSAKDLATIGDWAESFLQANRELFERRVSGGFIRDCDGDIHLANICLTDGQVCIFDCIEFNQRFRYSDTAADIAFLLMDLDFHQRSDLGHSLLEEYQAVTDDRESSLILDYYKCYRAFIRGKVAGFQLLDAQIPAEIRSESQERARRYFRLARGYALRTRLPKTLFITCGLMGSGKSSLAHQLAMELGLTVLSSDLTRKRLAGISPTARMADPYGEGLYSRAVSQATYTALFGQAELVLSSGNSVIIDASFRRQSDRRMATDLAQRSGAGLCILYLNPPEQIIRERLSRRLKDPQRISDGRPELLAPQKGEFGALQSDEGRVIDVATETSVTDATDLLLKELQLL